jgi:RecB family exonuclease
MIFLGWDRPLLDAAADWLLDPEHLPEAPDLSGVVVVLRGARAGRRLLELLALKAAERRVILMPPEIVTPSNVVWRLTRNLPDETRPASDLASALAWAEAMGALADAHRDRLFRHPGAGKTPPGLRTFLGLGRHLSQLWAELGGAGLSFREVIRVLGERFPHIADFEIPRWEVLESLHRRAGEILAGHGQMDRTDLLIRRAARGELLPGRRVVLAGVAEMPGVVRDFFRRFPEPPVSLVFAPESERDGFDAPGILRPAYWEKRSAGLDAGQIHPVERDRDQALRTAAIVKSWHEAGIPPEQMTVAIPRAAALPRLREALETEQFKTRWAQGRPAADAPALQLLRLVAGYLDHEPDEPPLYEAVAALARHPDLPGIKSTAWPALDQFAADHLPARFDPGDVAEIPESVHELSETLERVVELASDEQEPLALAEWTLRFLHRIYGERRENAGSPEGRVAVHGLKLLRDLLAETMQGRLPWPRRVRPADFLHIMLGHLGEETVPEPSDPRAIQGVGWLELVEDDAPAVVVTSFVESAIPESVSSDPFLPGALRQALSLLDNDARFARDAYGLAALVGSRSGGRGAVALVAPRFDETENPVRPSRLLLAGLTGESLARRVWFLAGRRPPEPQLPLREAGRFPPIVPAPEVRIEAISATAFRDYLESPRKFYFQHVLHLRDRDDAAVELDGAGVGRLIHEVLASFGADASVRDADDESVIRDYLLAEFDRVARDRFGRWAQPAVEIQLEEVRRRLSGFVRAQAGLRREGWTIRHVEGAGKLACELEAGDGAGTCRLTGQIDRIDFHPGRQLWRIVDYKTSMQAREPWTEHWSKSRGWKDLQLPLYLKLAAAHARAEWGVGLTPENTQLVYFLFPEKVEKAGVSRPFPADRIGEAWTRAAEIAARILRGEFSDNPPLRTDRNDPALLALCGQVGLQAPDAAPVVPAV